MSNKTSHQSLFFREMGQGPPLIILHALLGSGENWLSIAKALADRWHVWLPDLPNHGQSPWRDTMRYFDLAQAVCDWMDHVGVHHASVIGHSMGGKTAMQLTQMIPDQLDKVVVVDIAPIAYGDRHGEIFEALKGVDLHTVSRGDIDRELSTQLSDPMLRAFLMKNLVREGETFRWRIPLDTLVAQYPKIRAAPDLHHPFAGPVLFLRGEQSDYIPASALPVIRQWFPDAQVETISGAGHWMNAENPLDVTAAIRLFLEE